jgi:UPF0176 protein
MEQEKILLYYGFTPLEDPTAIQLWQKTLCESLGLKGRILISKHGINGTVGGDIEALRTYVKKTKRYPGFKRIDFKWSAGGADDFPKLSVKVRDEIVAFGAPEEIKVDKNGIIGGGTHLTPEQVNELVEARGDEVVFFDGRNAFEAKIGRFENAVIPNVETTHGFIAELESGKYDHLKDKPIVSYCTGGIRCEILSTLMKNRGFNEVYQIKGGIVRYGERYADKSHWKGSLYVFDKRMVTDFSADTEVIGECEKCSAKTNQFYNCSNLACRELTLLCDECAKTYSSESCIHQLVNN